jgi:glycosyltransferase involved in cell wall biosynthesis
MNCHDGDAFLEEALNSVIAQTWTNWELIFWDNQSKDDSALIVKKYTDPRIKYFRSSKHTMLCEARNRAIDRAFGEFLAFLDVDDWWLPQKLEKQIVLFSDPEVALVYGNYWIRSEQKNRSWIAHKTRLPEGRILEALLEDYKIGLPTLMLRRACLPSSELLFDPRYHVIGDFDLVVRIAADRKIACLQAPVAVYRVHTHNGSKLFKNLYLAELESWYREKKGDQGLSLLPSFRKFGAHLEYLRSINYLFEGHRRKALCSLGKMGVRGPWLRLIVLLSLPKVLLRRLKS